MEVQETNMNEYNQFYNGWNRKTKEYLLSFWNQVQGPSTHKATYLAYRDGSGNQGEKMVAVAVMTKVDGGNGAGSN